jgi:hypothetical protein
MIKFKDNPETVQFEATGRDGAVMRLAVVIELFEIIGAGHDIAVTTQRKRVLAHALSKYAEGLRRFITSEQEGREAHRTRRSSAGQRPLHE